MGAIHRVIPDDRPGQVWWFHGNSGSGKTNIALKFDVPNKIVLDTSSATISETRNQFIKEVDLFLSDTDKRRRAEYLKS